MAFVFKQPSGSSPGVIIFKHLEKRFFVASCLNRALQSLREHYVIGMYFGGYTPRQKDIPHVDFFLSSPGTMVQERTSKTPRIHLNGFNFIPSYFSPDPTCAKAWDILCVASNARVKRVDQLLVTLRRLLEIRPSTTAMIITQSDEVEDLRQSYVEIAEDYRRLFPGDLRQNVALLRLKREDGIFNVPPRFMAQFFRMSRMFILMSDAEGAARVVAEALMSGVPVITKAALKGGTNHYLDETNSLKLDDLQTAPAAIAAALDDPSRFSLDQHKVRAQFSEEASTAMLVEELRALFKVKGYSFEGPLDLVDLKAKIPSHSKLLPRRLCEGESDAIRSHRAMLGLTHLLVGFSPNTLEKVAARILDVQTSAVQMAKSGLTGRLYDVARGRRARVFRCGRK